LRHSGQPGLPRAPNGAVELGDERSFTKPLAEGEVRAQHLDDTSCR
jgi:hypothetical protein